MTSGSFVTSRMTFATGVTELLIRQAEEIAERRGLSLRTECAVEPEGSRDGPVSRRSDRGGHPKSAGCEPHRMVSGAGHDAMILAEKVPAAMIFLRTPGGISHDPAESVEIEDVAKALECGLHLLDQLASSS